MTDAVSFVLGEAISSHVPVDARVALSESSDAFRSCCTELKVGEQKVSVRLLLMNSSSMLFISHGNAECLDELAVAMPARKIDEKQLSSSTTLIGKEHSSKSQRLAEQLTKRYGRQFFVSSNIRMDGMIGSLLERDLSDWLQKQQSGDLQTKMTSN